MPSHRSEEHTSELQSHDNLVCRLLLEKKSNHRSAAHDHAPLPLSPYRARRHDDAPRALRQEREGDAGLEARERALAQNFFFKDPAPPEISPLSPPGPFPI